MKSLHRKIIHAAVIAGVIMTIAVPAWAMPWPVFRDADFTEFGDSDPRTNPTWSSYKEYISVTPWPKWADKEIKEAISWDLMRGYPDGRDNVNRHMYRFNAEKEITRFEFVAILNRALGYDEDAKAAKTAFPGEPIPGWAAGHLGTLVQKGIVDKGGAFDGNRPATRREIAVWVGRAVKAEKLSLTVDAPSFPDFKQGDEGYDDAVYAVRAGLMKGYEDGAFRPDATFTRAQSAAVIVRFAKSLPPGEWTMTADEFIQWWEMATIAMKAGWPENPPDEVFLAWMTPEHLEMTRSDMNNSTGWNTGRDIAVNKGQWYPYIDGGKPALRVPGSPLAVARVRSRTVMAYDIGYVPIGEVKANSGCWKTEPTRAWRVYLRRYPHGLRISDTAPLASRIIASIGHVPPGGIEEWWTEPSWYKATAENGYKGGPALYERLPDGSFRYAGRYNGPGTGACAFVQEAQR